MDRAPHSVDRTEGRGEIEVGGREVAGGRDLAVRVPVDPPLTADRAVDERDHGFGEARELLGLEVGPEGEARHVEDRMAGGGRQLVLDGHVGDERARRRVTERSGGTNVVVRDGQLQVVAAQRVEARVGVAVADERASVDRDVAAADSPAARDVAQQQRDIADRRPGVAELSAGPSAGEAAGQAR